MKYFVLIFFSSMLCFGQNSQVLEIKDNIESSPINSFERFQHIMELAEFHRPFPFSKAYENEGMPYEYYTYALEAYNWANESGTKAQIAKSSRFLIDYYCYSKNIEMLVSLGSEMVNNDNFASLQDKHFICLKLAEAYKETGFIKEYIDLTSTLYEVGRQLKLISSHAHEEYNHIAMAYYELKEYDMARFYFRKSINKLKKTDRPFAEASVNNNIGLSFSKEDNKDSAAYYFNKSLKKLEQASAEKEGFGTNSYNQHFKNIIKANLAYLDISEGNYDIAIKAIKRELKTAIIENENNTEIQAYNKLAFLNYKKKDYNRALYYLNKAEEKIAEGTNNSLRLNIWDLKAKVFLAKGNQEQSDVLFIKKNKLQDSIASIETKKTARVASVLYEVKKKDLEIKSQKTNIALLDSQNRVKSQLLIFGGLGLIFIFSFIVLIRSRNTAKRRQKLQEGFSQDLIGAQETERSRLALELHDSVGQQLMMLTRKSKNNGDAQMEKLASSTLSNLRSISRNLHPSAIEQLGFTAAIEDFINGVDSETDTFFTLDIHNFDEQLKKEQTLHLYRIIQELITNMIKHANAKSAEISIKEVQNNLKLIVKDSGIGFDYHTKLKTSKSLGMKSVEERCKILNAKLNVISKRNIGTKVSVVMPLSV